MPWYRRLRVGGGTYFFTLVTESRAPIFAHPNARPLLHSVLASCGARHPFSLDAIVLLPDHIHMLWALPPGDCDFSSRIATIKRLFTRAWLAAGGAETARSPSRVRHRRRGVWQRHFWEHLIPDEKDLVNHLDYIHYNPVKHGLATCPHGWPHSSFRRRVSQNDYEAHWQCCCDGRAVNPPDFGALPVGDME